MLLRPALQKVVVILLRVSVEVAVIFVSSKSCLLYTSTELRKRGGLSSTLVEKLDEMGILGNMPEDNQLSLFDDFF